MGCTTSRNKFKEKESWNAQVCRSISAPIHYPADNEEDSCHVVFLASSSYGILEMERPGDLIRTGSFVRILHDKCPIREEKNKSFFSTAMTVSHTESSIKLRAVQEDLGNESDLIETIDTCELMDGLNEDGDMTHLSLVVSEISEPLETPLKSFSESQMSSASHLGSAEKSPPTFDSACASPLFDPSLLETFELALDATELPLGEWKISRDIVHEESLTNSSASSGNNTWELSETSSDAESYPQPEDCVHSCELRSIGAPSQGMLKKASICERKLESFEWKCPPGGAEKVVLYFTSLRGIRKTYEDCCDLRLILQGFTVRVDERDVWMHSQFREELRELLQSQNVQVPRLFIKGRYIGGAEDVRRLNDNGVLVSLIESLPCLDTLRKVCPGCADVRFIPCLTCNGSCKVHDAMYQTLRCDKCNENGLMMCPLCI
ncbi:hypothetical protein KP509_20G051300 [Ceratopteris richardii]|uniref:Glutaredoxin domain-containing protein n=1 Tax=Ceratopteris richardii TaxID=49495 RepID=A0A8T2SF89_CERRI|nr:hypothetical protein KP509_20G051300 [Ceratopteris richardii]